MARAFVIMPFDAGFDAVFDLVIRPSLESEGLEVLRADTLDTRQNILKDVIGGITNADLVVADISVANANVYYELGVAHGLRKPTLLLTQSVEEVPFDLRSYRLLVYSTHIARSDVAKSELAGVARGFLDGRILFGSPVTDFAGAEVWAAVDPGDEHDPPIGESLSEDDADGVLDSIVKTEESSAVLIATIEAIGESISDVGVKVARHTEDMESASTQQGATRAALAVTLATARDITKFAEALEGQLPLFESSSVDMVDGFTKYADWLMTHPGADTSDAAQLAVTARGTLVSVSEALASTREFRDSVVAQKGFSRELNRALSGAARALEGVISVMERVEAHYARVIEVADALEARDEGPRDGDQ